MNEKKYPARDEEWPDYWYPSAISEYLSSTPGSAPASHGLRWAALPVQVTGFLPPTSKIWIAVLVPSLGSSSTSAVVGS